MPYKTNVSLQEAFSSSTPSLPACDRSGHQSSIIEIPMQEFCQYFLTDDCIPYILITHCILHHPLLYCPFWTLKTLFQRMPCFLFLHKQITQPRLVLQTSQSRLQNSKSLLHLPLILLFHSHGNLLTVLILQLINGAKLLVSRISQLELCVSKDSHSHLYSTICIKSALDVPITSF